MGFNHVVRYTNHCGKQQLFYLLFDTHDSLGSIFIWKFRFTVEFGIVGKIWVKCVPRNPRLAHPEFGSSVNPIPTKWADYAHHISVCTTGFENLTATLLTYLVNIQVSHLVAGS